MIMKTNVSDYTLVAILLIIIEEKEVYPVTFHSYMFKVVEINYNTHNKELLTVLSLSYLALLLRKIRTLYRCYYEP